MKIIKLLFLFTIYSILFITPHILLAQVPAPPNLLSPPDGSTLYDPTPEFIWYDVANVDSFNLVVEYAKQVINIVTAETTYTPLTNLNEGIYLWRVRSKGTMGNWGNYSSVWAFELFYLNWGWAQKESMPTQVARKYVRDGGSLTTVDPIIFAFRGNRSSEFYKYDDSWIQKETIPYGYKYPVTDPPKINKKKIDEGASLCWDGDNAIYATKGAGTTEFWAYDIYQNTWTAKAFVPSERGLRGGTSLAYYNGRVYLLAGEQSDDAPTNFFAYTPSGDTVGGMPWLPLIRAPLIPDGKPFRDGSCIVSLENCIYALKGRGEHNYFWAYDIVSNTWTQKETIPLVHPLNQTGDDFKDEEVSVWDGPTDRIRKTKVKEGGAMTTDGSVIYAIKGGGAQDFWQYTPNSPYYWTPLDTIPRLHRQSVPKHGAALTFTNGKVYLLKGNNTPEFWQYIPTTEMSKVKGQMSKAITNTQEVLTLKQVQGDRLVDVIPNPFTKHATIRYAVPISGKVSVKLYNTTGRLTQTLNDGYLNAGIYTTTLSTKNLAKGIYFLRYNNNANQKEIKLIVQ